MTSENLVKLKVLKISGIYQKAIEVGIYLENNSTFFTRFAVKFNNDQVENIKT